MDFQVLRFWAKSPPKLACARCGLKPGVAKSGVRARFRIDPNAWARQCAALKQPDAPVNPFDCPHLKASLRRHREPSAEAAK